MLLAGEMAGVGGAVELIDSCCRQMARRYSPSIEPPYCAAMVSQNLDSFAFTIRLSLSLSMLSELQCTRSCFPAPPPLPDFPFVCRLAMPFVGSPCSAGFGSKGLPLIFERGLMLVLPTFLMAPEPLTGEKLEPN